jgi:hypothetical protein
MADLTTELTELASDGAGRATVPAVGEIVRRGDRRRRRTIAQRVAGAASAAAIVAAMALTSAAGGQTTGQPAASGAAGGTAVTETSTNAAGMLSIGVKYRHQGLKILPTSVSYSGSIKDTVKNPVLVVQFRSIADARIRPKHRAVVFIILKIKQHSLGSFSGVLPGRVLRFVKRRLALHAGDTVTLTLASNLGRIPPGVTLKPVIAAGAVFTIP